MRRIAVCFLVVAGMAGTSASVGVVSPEATIARPSCGSAGFSGPPPGAEFEELSLLQLQAPSRSKPPCREALGLPVSTALRFCLSAYPATACSAGRAAMGIAPPWAPLTAAACTAVEAALEQELLPSALLKRATRGTVAGKRFDKSLAAKAARTAPASGRQMALPEFGQETSVVEFQRTPPPPSDLKEDPENEDSAETPQESNVRRRRSFHSPPLPQYVPKVSASTTPIVDVDVTEPLVTTSPPEAYERHHEIVVILPIPRSTEKPPLALVSNFAPKALEGATVPPVPAPEATARVALLASPKALETPPARVAPADAAPTPAAVRALAPESLPATLETAPASVAAVVTGRGTPAFAAFASTPPTSLPVAVPVQALLSVAVSAPA